MRQARARLGFMPCTAVIACIGRQERSFVLHAGQCMRAKGVEHWQGHVVERYQQVANSELHGCFREVVPVASGSSGLTAETRIVLSRFEKPSSWSFLPGLPTCDGEGTTGC